MNRNCVVHGVEITLPPLLLLLITAHNQQSLLPVTCYRAVRSWLERGRTSAGNRDVSDKLKGLIVAASERIMQH